MDPASSPPAMPPRPSLPHNNNNSPHKQSDTTPSNHNLNPPLPSYQTSQNSNNTSTKPPLQSSQSHNFFTYPMTYAVSGILRRLSTDPLASKSQNASRSSSLDNSLHDSTNHHSEIFHAPKRTASPFQPPPLTPLTLSGWRASTKENSRLLTRALAEEIRLLVPARLQLVADWKLIYSLSQDGTSLSTLYAQNEGYRGRRGAFVLVVRDGKNSTFGAYLSDALHPSAHYYGTGECFLWKASVAKMLDLSQLALELPPPPSEDTTDVNVRTTTLLSPKRAARVNGGGVESVSGTSTPERIRFKAFPYSGVNDYMIFCESGYLSVGGGDGHYGLWLDDSLDKGVSSTCLTFGNEPLSEQGGKFDVMGVELWYIGN